MATNGTTGTHGHGRTNGRGSKQSIPPASLTGATEDDSYRVGPGRPPREHQFKPGQSGNPSGIKRKDTAITRDLKSALERALSTKIKLGRGDKQRTVTKAVAGIQTLVDQFVNGDRHARHDLIAIAKTVGFDLTMGQGKAALLEAFTAKDEALLADYFQRNVSRYMASGNTNGAGVLHEDDSARAATSNSNRNGKVS